MKKIIILLMALLLSLVAVSAEDFEFELSEIRAEIDSGENAQYLLIITNNMNSIKEFRVYSPDIEWDVPTEDIKAYPKGDTSHKLIITPSKYVEPGKIYGVKINVKDLSTDEVAYTGIAQVNVRSSDKAISAYRPSIRVTVDMLTTVDPSKAVNVKVRLENQNLLDLSDLLLKISSDASGFETEQEVKLIPLGKKIVEFNYDIDPLQQPGEYKLIFELWKEGEAVERVVKPITIAEIGSAFKEDETVSDFLFKKRITKTVTSISNIDSVEIIKIPTTIINNIFTSVNLDASTEKEDGQRYIVIDVPLKPGESKEVVITTNYRIIMYLIILGAILLFIYYRYRSPLTIRKTVSDVGTKEGGISEMKVTLGLTSNAKKTIKKATITDYVPNIAHIAKEFGEGTLRPSRAFRHKTKGMVMKWDIEDIAPGEDRLISYTIKSKLSIIGKFSIPRAKVSFKRKGKTITGYSNLTGVST
ncbi:hypothetical protein KY332_02570 [Candidatus Woesearchaeota archaeon]|nr:hypothetical protein [Candidatus Woesearchaeota archaeon]